MKNFQSYVDLDLVENQLILGQISKNPLILAEISENITFFTIFNVDNFQRWSREIYKNTHDHKNSPEMNELDRDMIAVQFLASNFEKQKF